MKTNPYVDQQGRGDAVSVGRAVRMAERRIRPYLPETAVSRARTLDPTGALYFKLENQQPTGSFKIRGATNRVLSLSEEERRRGLITASTGNHGAGVAQVAGRLGIALRVLVPEGTPPARVAAIERGGVEVLFSGAECAESEAAARSLADESGCVYVSPYNDAEIVAGQGTLAAELLRQVPHVGRIYVAVGGGGLIGGIAGYVAGIDPTIEVVGCSPKASCAMAASVVAGRVVDVPHLETLSRGTAGAVEADSITFALCRDFVDRWELVEEREIAESIRAVLEHEHLMMEGAAGAAHAVWARDEPPADGRPACVVVCGGNLDVEDLRQILGDSPVSP